MNRIKLSKTMFFYDFTDAPWMFKHVLYCCRVPRPIKAIHFTPHATAHSNPKIELRLAKVGVNDELQRVWGVSFFFNKNIKKWKTWSFTEKKYLIMAFQTYNCKLLPGFLFSFNFSFTSMALWFKVLPAPLHYIA